MFERVERSVWMDIAVGRSETVVVECVEDMCSNYTCISVAGWQESSWLMFGRADRFAILVEGVIKLDLRMVKVRIEGQEGFAIAAGVGRL